MSKLPSNTLIKHSDIAKPSVITSPAASQAGNALDITELSAQAKALMAQGTSDNTRKSYQSAIKQFIRWGGRLPSNKVQVINYIAAKSNELNSRSLDLHLTAISQWHYLQEFADPVRTPEVKKMMQGLRRVHGKAKVQAKAISLQELKAMTDGLHANSASELRNKALLLVGFFGALRRSELVAIKREDLSFSNEGVQILITRSKTDQFGDGRLRAIPYAPSAQFCPVTALKIWLEHSNGQSEFVFCGVNRWQQISTKAISTTAVNQILKSIAAKANIGDVELISGHSLRRGMATQCAKAGIDFAEIKRQGGWKSDQTVWQYIEQGRAFEDNAAKSLYDMFANS